MNPIFPAMMQALWQANVDLMLGLPHVSKAHAKPTDGPAFAKNIKADAEFPRSDLIVMAEEEEAERDVRAHLDRLAEEAKARAATYPDIGLDVRMKEEMKK